MQEERKINILGINHTIEYTDIVDGDKNVLGMIDYHQGKIYIKEGLGKEIEESVIIHECIHGLLSALGHDELSEDEKLVTQLDNGIYQLFKENKIID